MKNIVLLGNPNCGKSTLFNLLTKENQRVGNWPGVTIEKKTGCFALNNENYQITDLPGIYSLTSDTKITSPDALITTNVVISSNIDLIINVIDACSLERHLYLTSQILELGIPVIIVLNMMDLAQQRGIIINTDDLSKKLHVPVIPMIAHKQTGIDALYAALHANNPVR